MGVIDEIEEQARECESGDQVGAREAFGEGGEEVSEDCQLFSMDFRGKVRDLIELGKTDPIEAQRRFNRLETQEHERLRSGRTAELESRAKLLRLLRLLVEDMRKTGMRNVISGSQSEAEELLKQLEEEFGEEMGK